MKLTSTLLALAVTLAVASAFTIPFTRDASNTHRSFSERHYEVTRDSIRRLSTAPATGHDYHGYAMSTMKLKNGRKLSEINTLECMIEVNADVAVDDVLGEVKSLAAGPSAFEATVGYSYHTVFHGFSGRFSAQALEFLQKHPAVKSMTHVQSVHAIGKPGSAAKAATEAARKLASQPSPIWNLDRVDGTDDNTYNYPNGGDVATVVVLDTGIRMTHSEFANTNMFSGYDAVDDDEDSSDCQGHGTHCAGTVAGMTYGVAKSTNVVASRVLSCTGSGSTAGVVAGMDKAVERCTGASTISYGDHCILSMSLGGGSSSTLDAAVARAYAAGIVTVAAAGNDASDACQSSPAGAPEALTVGAAAQSGSSLVMSSFSNYGACVNIFAPGSSITSATQDSDTSSGTWDGTSMATPHVAGALALIMSSPGWIQTPGNDGIQAMADLLCQAEIGALSGELNNSPNLFLRVADVCTSCGVCDCEADTDEDGLIACEDNCPRHFNPDQEDLDQDGLGDLCDPDRDGDGRSNENDAFPDDPERFCYVNEDNDDLCECAPDSPPECVHEDFCIESVTPLQPGSTLYITDGSDGNYENYVDCTQTYEAPAGSHIEFTVEYFETESRYDYLYFYSGSSTIVPSFLAMDGSHPSGTRVVSPSNVLTLRFSTDYSVVRDGYGALLTVVPDECGDSNGDGFCDGGTCTDPSACNTGEEGECAYQPDPARACDGRCFSDSDGDGECDQYDQDACPFMEHADTMLYLDYPYYSYVSLVCYPHHMHDCARPDWTVGGRGVWIMPSGADMMTCYPEMPY